MAMSGFLIAVSCWRPRLQCIVIVRSFLRLPRLHKLAVGKRGGDNLCQNIPLNRKSTKETFSPLHYLIGLNLILVNLTSWYETSGQTELSNCTQVQKQLHQNPSAEVGTLRSQVHSEDITSCWEQSDITLTLI